MYTVVVADDEEELRKALIRKVDWEGAGFSVVGEAANGVEALELVEKYEPDLLLTDIKMPYISGIELARQVREVRPATMIAFLSGYDDFSYAQQAIQYNIISYMLKPISSVQLMEELAKIKKKIDERFEEFAEQEKKQGQNEAYEFLMPLIFDGFGDMKRQEAEDVLKEQAVSYGLMKDVDNEFCYTVLVTSIFDENGENCTSAATVNAVDMILKKYVRYTSFYVDGRVITLLMATMNGFDKYLHILVEEIEQSMKRIMNRKTCMGVSRVEYTLSKVHEAYAEAMNAMSYARKKGKGIYFISDIERFDDFDMEKMQNAVNVVEEKIRVGSEQELRDVLHRTFEDIEREHVSSVVVNFFLMQLNAMVFKLAYGVAEGEALQEMTRNVPMYSQLYSENLPEIEKSYITFCLSVRELISEQRKKSSTVICDKALELIEKRYMDQELSLVSISTEIAVSPNYLSSLIKKRTGSTFVDLLTEKRMETAKNLLDCSAMKIKEISEKCGYNDQHYFSYCFKKYTGSSPNACRRNHHAEE